MTVYLKRYDHVTPFVDAAYISSNLQVDVLIPKKKLAHLCNVSWKAGSVSQMFYSGGSETKIAEKVV